VIRFNFYCPVENKDSIATADPVAVLFLATGTSQNIELTCESCGTRWLAEARDDGLKTVEQVVDEDDSGE
jgi:hypothetical protein